MQPQALIPGDNVALLDGPGIVKDYGAGEISCSLLGLIDRIVRCPGLRSVPHTIPTHVASLRYEVGPCDRVHRILKLPSENKHWATLRTEA
jgi:hypothetical protein